MFTSAIDLDFCMAFETYSLFSGTSIQNMEFHPGDEVVFDASTGDLWIRRIPFLGFRDEKGKLHVYTNSNCSQSTKINTTLDPVVMVGATIRKVQGIRTGSEKVVLHTDKGILTMEHAQECCERVELVDVTGDPEDLVGGLISVFEVRSGTRDGTRQKWSRKKPTVEDRFAWRIYTFYEIRTSRGDVTLRWGEPDNHDDNRYGEGITLTLCEIR